MYTLIRIASDSLIQSNSSRSHDLIAKKDETITKRTFSRPFTWHKVDTKQRTEILKNDYYRPTLQPIRESDNDNGRYSKNGAITLYRINFPDTFSWMLTIACCTECSIRIRVRIRKDYRIGTDAQLLLNKQQQIWGGVCIRWHFAHRRQPWGMGDASPPKKLRWGMA